MVRIQRTAKKSATGRSLQYLVGHGSRRIVNKKPRKAFCQPRNREIWGFRAQDQNANSPNSKQPFIRLLEQIVEDIKPGDNYRIDNSAIVALEQVATNFATDFVTRELKMASMWANHAGRVTVQESDMKMARIFRNKMGG